MMMLTDVWLWLVSLFTDHLHIVVMLALPIAVPLILFQILPLLVLIERRGAAFIQDRIGPHRAGINISGASVGGLMRLDASKLLSDTPQPGLRLRAFGMLYNMTDLVKILFKEHFIAPFADGVFYKIAPAIPIVIALITTGLLPWFAPFTFQATSGTFHSVVGQAIDAHSGLLALFALASLGVYGVVLGSWASNSKYALLGGMRSSAMMISYEVSMGLSVLGLLLIYGTFSLSDAVAWQTGHAWGIFVQPVAFFLFLVAMFAEANRNPFDVAEGESEIVAGFHTEFNGIRFMLFMTAEYFHVLIASALISLLFLGGWDPVPFADFNTTWISSHLGLALAVFLAVTGILLGVFAVILAGRRSHYAKGTASDKVARMREYGVYVAGLSGAALLSLIGAFLIVGWRPDPVATHAGLPVFSNHINLLTALLQAHILLGKTLLVCCLFVWVRWTLPRFRYDQIMALGWKVLLNIALVNLLATAIIVALVKG